MPLRILVRHAESTYNVEGRINGDPVVPVPLSARGRAEAAELALHIAHVGIGLHTRFPRTIETARLALAQGRAVGSAPELLVTAAQQISATAAGVRLKRSRRRAGRFVR